MSRLAPAATATPDPRVAVVIIAMNARARIGRALAQLSALPEAPRVVVVDNASTDGTGELIRRRFPHVDVVRLTENRGAAGRNVGVAVVDTPYVAFAEDDSWYEAGALREAADLLDAHPDVALINAHVLVGGDGHRDPVHTDMVDTGLPDRPDLPGHPLISFLEGVSVVRRTAYLAVGGFDARLCIGGPEEHLAAALLDARWLLRYVPSVRARHVPDHTRQSTEARRLGLRNTLWFAWGRRPLRPALRWTAHVLADSPPDRTTLSGLAAALVQLPRVLRERKLLTPTVERQFALLDDQKIHSSVRRYAA
jgi:N-acetylglucosaminyl-diphospho-decaprenol L-rhamnosyltransferase